MSEERDPSQRRLLGPAPSGEVVDAIVVIECHNFYQCNCQTNSPLRRLMVALRPLDSRAERQRQ